MKKALTLEQEQFVVENYRTMNNAELGAVIDRNPKVVIRIMNKLGVFRTPEEKQALITRALGTVDTKARGRRMSKIEGGTRDSYRRKYHLERWTEINGRVRKGNVLVYATGKFDSFDDLILIRKSKLESFLRSRERALKKLERDEKKKQKKVSVAKKARRIILSERKRAEDSAKANFEEFKRNYKQKSVVEAQKELVDQGKVPVKLDSKTTIWVSRDKCVRLDSGEWVKK